MQRSSLSLRDFILWTQTRLQPQTWSLTLRLWWPTLRPALRQIAPQSREKSRFISTAISRYIAVFLCPKSFFFLLSACSATWMRMLSSPSPPTLLCCLCWTTTTGWLDRQRTSALSSWLSRTSLSGKLCPTLSWDGSCLLFSTTRVKHFYAWYFTFTHPQQYLKVGHGYPRVFSMSVFIS